MLQAGTPRTTGEGAGLGGGAFDAVDRLHTAQLRVRRAFIKVDTIACNLGPQSA